MDTSPLSTLPNWGVKTLQDFDTSNMQIGQRIGGTSNTQFVRFYKKVVPQFVAKEVKINPKTGATKVLAKEMVEVEKEFVEIITPGDKNTVDTYVEDFHKREYFDKWQAFRQGRAAPLGMSIDEVSFVNFNVAIELHCLHVHTVEQLAEATDQLCNLVPGGWEMREFARAWCKSNDNNKNIGQINVVKSQLITSQQTVEKQGNLIADLQAQMTQLKTLLDSKGNPVGTNGYDEPKVAKRGPKAKKVSVLNDNNDTVTE